MLIAHHQVLNLICVQWLKGQFTHFTVFSLSSKVVMQIVLVTFYLRKLSLLALTKI